MGDKPRLVPIRNLLDDVRSISRGYGIPRRGRRAPLSILEQDGWQVLSEFRLSIFKRNFGTEFYSRLVGNLSLGCEMLDMTHLRPGELFSMRKSIGNVNEEERFAVGLTIVNGRLAPQGRGGGICHVATALFNAALDAGLDIVEKHNHSRDLWGEQRTVPLGRDATYVWAVKDLKFANPWNTDVLIRADTNPAAEVLTTRILARNAAPVQRTVHHEIADQGDAWHVVTTVHDNGGATPKHRWIERYLKADPSALEAYHRLNPAQPEEG